MEDEKEEAGERRRRVRGRKKEGTKEAAVESAHQVEALDLGDRLDVLLP